MAALLALGAAATWGVGDFLGALASRRTNELVVTTVSQAAGLLVLAVLLALGSTPATAPALAWGAVAGIGGAGGLAAYFRALAIGPMGVTAPVAALTGAVVPVVAGVLLGERPGTVAWVGVVVGVAATALASRPAETAVAHPERHPEQDAAALRRGITAAAVAGLLFGLFFVALDRAPADGGLWPLLGARASGLTMLGLLLAVRRPARPDRGSLRLATVSGLLDMLANSLFLLAVQRGLLVLVSVLTSLYPVGVVLLARIVLGERLGQAQKVGVVLAMLAVVLIAA